MIRRSYVTVAAITMGALAACGGKVEDFRTTEESPAPPPLADAAPAPTDAAAIPAIPAIPRRDGGACRFVPSTVHLTPNPLNERSCLSPVECKILTGHGAGFVHCAGGVGSEDPVFTEPCDEKTCTCHDDKVGFAVHFDIAWAYGQRRSRTCSYAVEVVPSSP